MSEITLTIEIAKVEVASWLRTSYRGGAVATEEGISLVDRVELGRDQRDAFKNFLQQGAQDILRLFTTRQYGLTEPAFEVSDTEIKYRFLEGDPPLDESQRASTLELLSDDVGKALLNFVMGMWYDSRNMEKDTITATGEYERLQKGIKANLLKLHD